MTFQSSIWQRKFEIEDFPQLPCPRCSIGTLGVVKNSYKFKDAHEKFSQEQIAELPEDYIDRRATMFAKCSRSKCFEVIAVMGDFSVEETDYEGRQVFADAFCIRGIFPAPHMIELPEKLPQNIRNQLTSAFELYWVNASACVNALRTASEMLLDEVKVPKKHRVKATANKPAKMVELNFNGRVQWLRKRNKIKANILDGLRRLGNLGSHPGDKIAEKDVHSGFRVLEHLLSDIYVKHSIQSIAAELGK